MSISVRTYLQWLQSEQDKSLKSRFLCCCLSPPVSYMFIILLQHCFPAWCRVFSQGTKI